MHRTGLAPSRQDDEAIRWITLRHAADYIHIVGMLARQSAVGGSASSNQVTVPATS